MLGNTEDNREKTEKLAELQAENRPAYSGVLPISAGSCGIFELSSNFGWNLDQETKEQTRQKTNSVALVRERTVPTERPPLVGEVSAKFCG
jgi:hypothetical protein